MNKSTDFLFPRLVGKRFDNHSIPLEFFPDLAALGELIFELAKWIYRSENKKRIPKNFFEGVTIKISDIKEGSAIPNFVLDQPTPPANLYDYNDKLFYFEKSRDHVMGAIQNADNIEEIDKLMPDYMLKRFDRIGRGLHYDEYIELKAPKMNDPVRYDHEKRLKLIKASAKAEKYTEKICVLGRISEADKGKKQFSITQIDNKIIRAPLEGLFKEEILEAFNYYEKNQIVNIELVGSYSINGNLQKIESVESIDFLEKLDVSVQIKEISLLKDGWLDGQGIAPDPDMLNWLSSEFDSNYHPDLPLPYLYPTADGGIQAEWTGNNWEISLEIDLSNKKAEFLAVNLLSKAVKEKEMDMSDPSGWADLNQTLKELLGAIE